MGTEPIQLQQFLVAGDSPRKKLLTVNSTIEIIRRGFFHLLDYITLIENLQIGDHKKRDMDLIYCIFLHSLQKLSKVLK